MAGNWPILDSSSVAFPGLGIDGFGGGGIELSPPDGFASSVSDGKSKKAAAGEAVF
jgi:hypothetical protein